jgi:hypothetical protein
MMEFVCDIRLALGVDFSVHVELKDIEDSYFHMN